MLLRSYVRCREGCTLCSRSQIQRIYIERAYECELVPTFSTLRKQNGGGISAAIVLVRRTFDTETRKIYAGMFIRERFNYDIIRTHLNLGVWGGQQLRERYAEGTTHRGRGPPR